MKNLRRTLAVTGLVALLASCHNSKPIQLSPPESPVARIDTTTNTISDHMTLVKISKISGSAFGTEEYSSRFYRITVPRDYSLSKIARELSDIEGTEVVWQDVYEYNQRVIGKNPKLIKPNQVLEYPSYVDGGIGMPFRM
jgi:hypothetical protein